jgi:hypothetical protein
MALPARRRNISGCRNETERGQAESAEDDYNKSYDNAENELTHEFLR